MIFPIPYTQSYISGLLGLASGSQGQCPPGYSYGIACTADYCTVMECVTPGCCTCRRRTEDPACASLGPSLPLETPQQGTMPVCGGLGYYQPCDQLTSCPPGYYIWREGDCCTCAISPSHPLIKGHLGAGDTAPSPKPNPCSVGYPCSDLVCPASQPNKVEVGDGCCQCKVASQTSTGGTSPAAGGTSSAAGGAPQDPLLRIADMITSIGGGGGGITQPQQQGLVTVPVQQQQRNTMALVLVLAAVAGVGYWYVRRYAKQ